MCPRVCTHLRVSLIHEMAAEFQAQGCGFMHPPQVGYSAMRARRLPGTQTLVLHEAMGCTHLPKGRNVCSRKGGAFLACISVVFLFCLPAEKCAPELLTQQKKVPKVN